MEYDRILKSQTRGSAFFDSCRKVCRYSDPPLRIPAFTPTLPFKTLFPQTTSRIPPENIPVFPPFFFSSSRQTGTLWKPRL